MAYWNHVIGLCVIAWKLDSAGVDEARNSCPQMWLKKYGELGLKQKQLCIYIQCFYYDN